MARKDTGQVTRPKGPGQRKNKTRSAKSSLPPYRSSRKKAYNPARRNPSPSRAKLIQVAGDMRRAADRGEKLTFSQAADNRGVDTRTRHVHVTKLFYKDSTGRIHARKTDLYAQQFSIPSTRPDVFDTITARGNEERSTVGRWLNALKAAADGDFSLLQNFPKNTFVDGRRLPTGDYEVQRILEALEQSETAFEQQYYGGAR